MPQKIAIKAGNLEIAAELNDSPTAKSIVDALPITASASRWGGDFEIAGFYSYFLRHFLPPGISKLIEASIVLVLNGVLNRISWFAASFWLYGLDLGH